MEPSKQLDQKVALSWKSLASFIEDPENKIYTLPDEDQLDILAAIQHHFELVQARVRLDNSEHSALFMEAHADVNYWKNKLMNAKAKIRLKISEKERGL